MKRDSRKSHRRTVASSQLDLFSRSIQPAESTVVQAPQIVQLLGEPAQLRDPLIDFVLAPNRGRGRPEKLLPIQAASPANGQRLLDVREAAQRLGLSKSTLDKMRCSGRGPRFIRATDRAIRYDPKDLDAFATERRVRSTSEVLVVI